MFQDTFLLNVATTIDEEVLFTSFQIPLLHAAKTQISQSITTL